MSRSASRQFAVLLGPIQAKALSTLAVSAVLAVTLWPWNPLPRNRVTWLRETRGLSFERAGLVVSNEPLQPPKSDGSESYTLELLLRPASIRSSGTVLAIYDPAKPTQFMVRQWKSGLLVTHDAEVDTDPTRTIKFDVDHAFNPKKVVLVTISSGSSGTAVYLDGQPAHSFPGFTISRNDMFGQIVLGTSAVAYDPWRGEIEGLAIYAKKLTVEEVAKHYSDWINPSGTLPLQPDAAIASYNFAEATGTEIHNAIGGDPNLIIPTRFSVPHKYFLRSPVKEFRSYRNYSREVAKNIAGFLPLGFVFCSYLSFTRSLSKATLITIAFCGLLSATIEVLQYYIPSRGSGITDIISNTLGGGLGALLVQSNLLRRSVGSIGLIRATLKNQTA